MYIITVPCLDLDSIYTTNQWVRWYKVKDGKYFVYHKDKMIIVEQTKQCLKFNCNNDDFYSIWYGYFAIDIDYTDVCFDILRMNRNHSNLIKQAKGVRVLRQDEWELRLLYMFSKHTTIERGRWLLEQFSLKYGKKHTLNNEYLGADWHWHEIPSYNTVQRNMNKILNDKQFVEYYQQLQSMLDNEIDKVDDYVKLFGYNDLTIAPVNKHLETAHIIVPLDMDGTRYNGVVREYILYLFNRLQEREKEKWE